MRGAVLTLISAGFLLASSAQTVNAHGFGVGIRMGHFAPGFRLPGHGPFRHRGFHGFHNNRNAATVVPNVVVVPEEAPAAPICRQVVTVPAEDGGSRQITITRCDQPDSD